MLELYLSTPKCQLDWYFKFLFLTRFYFDIHYTTPYPKRAKKTTRFWLIYRLIKLGEQGWRSGESTRVPPMWPGFKSRRRRHMWVEFVVGSLPCSERFFSGYSGFPLSSKTNTSRPNSNSIWNARTRLNESKRTLKCFVGKKAIYVYIFYI